MPKMDLVAEIKLVNDMVSEAMLCNTILSYARSGHASAMMVEQAIEILDKHVEINQARGWDSKTAEDLRSGLRQALVDGVGSLRSVRGPGPEVAEVEVPLAQLRVSLGHKVQRQRKCGGGVIDILDITANQIIECKYRGTSGNLGEAAEQLRRYSKSFPDAELVIAVVRLEPGAAWLADLLRREGFVILEVSG